MAKAIAVLYPDQSHEINDFDSLEDWRDSFATPDLPENVSKNAEPRRL